VISAVASVAGSIKTIMGLFSKGPDYNAEIANELAKTTATDQGILGKLSMISEALNRVDADVQKVGLQNQDYWNKQFTTGLHIPIDALSTRVLAYGKLKKPSNG
jgi:hypothetical protein